MEKIKELDIYCDASFYQKKQKQIGVGVCLIDEKENEEKFSIKTNIKLIKRKLNYRSNDNYRYNASICEGYAIFLALSQVNVKYEKIRLYTDNQHNFLLMNDFCKEAKGLLNIIVNRCKSIIKERNVEVRWIKAHVGVYGNDIADKLAKKSYYSRNSMFDVNLILTEEQKREIRKKRIQDKKERKQNYINNNISKKTKKEVKREARSRYNRRKILRFNALLELMLMGVCMNTDEQNFINRNMKLKNKKMSLHS